MRSLLSLLSRPHCLALAATSASFAACAAAAAAPPSPPFARVVSYNLLSSSLAPPSHFVACSPSDLLASTRLRRIEALLSQQTDAGALVCLQELSAEWVGALTPFFERKGYTFVTAAYGRQFDGYMGVGLAWPAERFESVTVELARAAETKEWPAAEGEGEKGGREGWGEWVAKWARAAWGGGGGGGERRFDALEEAARRKNVLLSAKLRCKRTAKEFSVSTYHMPCLFGSDEKVVVIHAALAAQRAAKFADGVPYILAGDFNFTPTSSPYKLITEGQLPAGHPQLPQMAAADAWRPEVRPPLRSAYLEALGAEPDFTNLALNKFSGEQSFCETLDYIFLSPGDWAVGGVKPLPPREAVLPHCKSYPSASEPSDHVLIWADLHLAEEK
ncbi:hypothetical protein AB1Y20_014372 [Prymnesium parvum]|uniref:Endonuclease/exonuclease/phosphatase domain-containing protein n=1 Tax=Prymnesium parvum TaxID=97485 RepID=A0AB34IG25_PRYPA